MKTCHGVTLVELLCVLAILAITFSIATPVLSMVQRSQVNSASHQLIGATQFTRSHAISQQRSTYFCLTQDGRNCSAYWSNQALSYYDEDGNKTLSADDTILRVYDFGKQVQIRWRAFQNKSYLEMTPRGTTYYQNGTYTVCHKNKNRLIATALVMNMGGRPYFTTDRNGDGVVEYSNGKAVSCD